MIHALRMMEDYENGHVYGLPSGILLRNGLYGMIFGGHVHVATGQEWLFMYDN
jgi:hypothetical protein